MTTHPSFAVSERTIDLYVYVSDGKLAEEGSLVTLGFSGYDAITRQYVGYLPALTTTVFCNDLVTAAASEKEVRGVIERHVGQVLGQAAANVRVYCLPEDAGPILVQSYGSLTQTPPDESDLETAHAAK